MADLKINNLTPPGIDGTYRGSCVACLRGTDTGIAFQGEAEWAIAGLFTLGVPTDEAAIMVNRHAGCDPIPGKVPAGEITVAVQVCRKCVDASGANFPIRPLSQGIYTIRPK